MVLWKKRHQYPKLRKAQSPVSALSPPADTPPGLVCSLLSANAEADWNSALATLIGLMQSGVIRVSRISSGAPHKAEATYAFTLADEPGSLLVHEQSLLRSLYGRQLRAGVPILLPQLVRSQNGRDGNYQRAVAQDLEIMGFLDSRLRAAEGRLAAVGILTFFFCLGAAVGFMLIGAPQGLWPIVFIPISMAALGLVAFAIGESMSPLTPGGMQHKEAWKTYFRNLKDFMQHAQAKSPLEPLWTALPYAGYSGLSEQLVAGLKRMPGVAPVWFPRLEPGDGDFSSFLAALFRLRQNPAEARGDAT